MDNADLRPALPWRRVMPGVYAAETPTGETYMVERTEDGWRVVLRGPRGGREVLGEPSRIKWVGQCRAENHYLHARRAKGSELSSEKLAAAAADAKQRKQKAAESTTRKSAPPEPSKPAAPTVAKPATRKGAKEPRASLRHRRTPPSKPAKPAKPAAPIEPLPAHTLAWKASQQNGREFHVAEHAGGLFKILEVKGTEGFALFSEPAGGVVQEIQCGSLDDCKQTAASLYERKDRKRKPADSDKPSRGQKKASAEAKGKDKPAAAKETAAAPAEAKEPAKSGACGCEPPAPAKAKAKADRAPLDQAKQAKIVDGLKAALRKVNPATLREG